MLVAQVVNNYLENLDIQLERSSCNNMQSTGLATLPDDVITHIINFALSEGSTGISHREHLFDCAVNNLVILNKEHYKVFKPILWNYPQVYRNTNEDDCNTTMLRAKVIIGFSVSN